jgi:hypothetical protein
MASERYLKERPVTYDEGRQNLVDLARRIARVAQRIKHKPSAKLIAEYCRLADMLLLNVTIFHASLVDHDCRLPAGDGLVADFAAKAAAVPPP